VPYGKETARISDPPCLARLIWYLGRASSRRRHAGLGWIHPKHAPFLTDFLRLYRGATPLVLIPRTVEESRADLRICNREEVAVVPTAATQLLRRRTPDETGTQVVLSLRRLNRIRQVDAQLFHDRRGGLYPGRDSGSGTRSRPTLSLELGLEGTAQIGGNLSTNAGGTAVLRYGMMRDLVLGLELVLADGRVLESLKACARTTPATT